MYKGQDPDPEPDQDPDVIKSDPDPEPVKNRPDSQFCFFGTFCVPELEA
jgi:hypothetical protein